MREDLLCGEIPADFAGQRVDKGLAALLTGHSRAAIQQWLKAGRVMVDSAKPRQRDRLRGGERYQIRVPEPEPAEWPAQEMALDVVFEDNELLVINKPAGLVVHPGAGNPDGTLLNGALYRDDSLRRLPRAGIVHRLDKDTSGLLVLARTETARQSLIKQLKTRAMHRRYAAVVTGIPVAGGVIDAPIGRHRRDRLRMAVTDRGKPAVTRYRVRDKYRAHALVEATLESGRTHQIRVHMVWKGFPLVGDPLYGGHPCLPPTPTRRLTETLRAFRRQALHAERLALIHPATGKEVAWESPMPADMAELVTALREDWEVAGRRRGASR
ncbi:MAG: 23S rRNA pseudouridine(1911/1915/1917) synthase RluD [Pseudomonadota bacterium]|nr:23S rRNA pseudouridine(1911/1915/1917) synthase RluD [Pseudomonadota bacterium]